MAGYTRGGPTMAQSRCQQHGGGKKRSKSMNNEGQESRIHGTLGVRESE